MTDLLYKQDLIPETFEKWDLLSALNKLTILEKNAPTFRNEKAKIKLARKGLSSEVNIEPYQA
jgi:hypothetical protein